jgi:hypothetical protein
VNLNRRGFIRALTACLVAIVSPTPKPNFGPRGIEGYLTDMFNTFMKGKGYKGPVKIYAGEKFYNEFAGNVQTVYRMGTPISPISTPNQLKFKSATMIKEGYGWNVRITQ